MRGAVITEVGDPSVVEVQDVPRPAVGPTDARVAVEAAAANYGDVWLRRGLAPAKPPVVPGLDAAGVVHEVGDDVAGVSPGDRVVVDGILACGVCEHCERGDRAMCVDYGAVGESRDGTHAEFVAVPASNLLTLPDDVGFEAAAALPSSFGTAHRALFTRGSLTDTDDVLVLGASGGVGHAVVLLAVDAGARVFACTSSERKATRLRELGVDHVVDYTAVAFDDAIDDLTDGRGVDIVFDSVGGEVYERGVRSLARGGRLLTVGATAGDADRAMLRHVFWKQLSVVGSTGYNPVDLQRILDLVASGAITPVVDSTVGLDALPEVHRRLEARDVFGKVLIRP